MITASDLSVVIPTATAGSALSETLAGLSLQDVTGFETVVVVDGLDVPAPAAGDGVDGPVVLVQPHRGPGAARNRGVARGERPLVLFLGDDMVPAPDLVRRHLEAQERHVARHGDRRTVVLGRARWHRAVAGGRCERWLERSGAQFDYGAASGSQAHFAQFYSCNVSMWRELFVSAGGFDERFAFAYEDLDAGYRLERAGMRLVHDPQAVTWHRHAYDLAALHRRFRLVGEGEHLMATLHPWFEPYFLSRWVPALDEPEPSPLWPRLERWIPRQAGRLAEMAWYRSDLWYRRTLVPSLLAGWWAADDLAELRDYLGERFDETMLEAHVAAVDQERDRAADEASFYRTSDAYLYDLTVFSMSATKAPYLAELRRLLAPDARVLDYGCGIGADGLRLAAAGMTVSFADFANPSTQYLRWRLARRNWDCPVHDLDAGPVPGSFDAAFSFDVIEHVDDPFAFLEQLEQRAGLVAVNLLEAEPGDTDLHRPLPIAALLDHGARRGLVRYRRYHGRSHLMIYRGSGPGVSRWRSRAQRQVGRWLARATPWFPRPLPAGAPRASSSSSSSSSSSPPHTPPHTPVPEPVPAATPVVRPPTPSAPARAAVPAYRGCLRALLDTRGADADGGEVLP